MNPAARRLPITLARGGELFPAEDVVAVEAPLEIRLGGKALTVTMRTPGHDAELAVGFLVSEGVLRKGDDLTAPPVPDALSPDVLHVQLRDGVTADTRRAERGFTTTSACGACGKDSLESLSLPACPPITGDSPQVSPSLLLSLPAKLRAEQATFEATGGLHATGLFTGAGELVRVREDVGRHNAFDKVIGAALLAGELPLNGCVAVVSGRASFELVQKAAMAGIPVLAAVGAPSSLAVELAQRQGITLAGFLRDGRFNLYSHPERITP
ncbi:MAG: formate dehydrogenase accessory sulfurtransferase FdhD [Deltaproteobacteria bacterium]|nr:formate dehydrogenase accessory sulfurtransferase FdhD [Deltaproteobacteria bacterium]